MSTLTTHTHIFYSRGFSFILFCGGAKKETSENNHEKENFLLLKWRLKKDLTCNCEWSIYMTAAEKEEKEADHPTVKFVQCKVICYRKRKIYSRQFELCCNCNCT